MINPFSLSVGGQTHYVVTSNLKLALEMIFNDTNTFNDLESKENRNFTPKFVYLPFAKIMLLP